MFVDFDKVFRKTPQTELQIPQELADQLSTNLPDGLHYLIDKEHNTLILSPEANEACTFSGITPEPTEEQKKVLGESYSSDDILQLAYNSQQPVSVRLKDDKYICINGSDVPLDKVIFDPFKPHKLLPDSIRIFPASFPPAFTLKIGCDTVAVELSVKRVPNYSLSEQAFESDSSKCLSIKYFIDPVNNKFSLTLNISKEKAATVKEIVDSLEIYNAFVEGKGKLGNIPLKESLHTTNDSEFNNEMLEFWKMVLVIEKKLNVSFNPNLGDLDMECICDVEEIYQCLINQTPIRHNTSINSITSKWEFKKDEIVDDVLKTPIYFEFDGTKEYELFGQTIVLQCIVGVFNAVIAKYEKNEEKGECTIFLEDESEEKKMYTSSLCFITKEEAAEYKKEVNDRIKLFMDAKTIQDFLSKE